MPTNSLRGHLQPLGFQRDSDGDITTLFTLPTNQQFYQLLLNKQTALLKSAASPSPAIEKWTEKYLQQEYGNLTLKLEGKTEDQDRPIGSLGIGFDTIENFVSTYRKEPKYAVTQLPDPMHRDIMVMPFMRCGPLSKSIIESHLWMSSGQTKSKLHRDNTYTLHCSIQGRKDWILMDSKYSHKMYLRNKADDLSGVSDIEPNSVNLKLYPRIAEIPFKMGNITPGDCILVPPGCAHQVRSHGPVNIAFTFLFEIDDEQLQKFDPIHCENNYISLNQHYLGWSYSGHGTLSMGNQEPYLYKNSTISEWFKGLSEIPFATMVESSSIKILKSRPKIHAEVIAVIKDILMRNKAIDSNGIIDKKRCLAIPVDDWKVIQFKTESVTNIQNDPNYEYYTIEYDMARDVIEDARDDRTGKFNETKFRIDYQAIDGSKFFADKIVAILDNNKDGLITSEEFINSLDEAVDSYKAIAIEDEDDKHKDEDDNEEIEDINDDSGDINGNNEEEEQDESDENSDKNEQREEKSPLPKHYMKKNHQEL